MDGTTTLILLLLNVPHALTSVCPHDPLVRAGTALRVLGRIYRTVLSEGPAGGVVSERLDLPEGGLDAGLLMAVLGTVLRYVDSSLESDRLSALQTICSFASHPSSLCLILEDPVLLAAWLGELGALPPQCHTPSSEPRAASDGKCKAFLSLAANA